MPERQYWESLFDVPDILQRLSIDQRIDSAIEVGCGYGTFTVPVAMTISGTLHAFDIEPAMIAATQSRIRDAGATNVALSHRDVIGSGFGLPVGSVDAVLLFNILHAENPTELLRASAEVVSRNGRVIVIHWRSDIVTPRGPELSIRPRPEQVITWGNDAGLFAAHAGPVTLPPWHFGLAFSPSKLLPAGDSR